ncbi:Putative methyltransferase [Apostasia shenzhenica]|uniref:Methyltransferase n=1 Tax=Apostasia shenzhenica TaxID=1088818 RepID=A0A2I0ANP2_9ASPA|nr:Putative methyltransferase [Apostasia shenzhenica]
MAASFRRVLAREWARRNPFFVLPAHAVPASVAAAAASFCTDADGSRVKIFDRDLKRKEGFHLWVFLQRDRAAWLMGGKDDFVDSVAENVLDRLEVSSFVKDFEINARISLQKRRASFPRRSDKAEVEFDSTFFHRIAEKHFPLRYAWGAHRRLSDACYGDVILGKGYVFAAAGAIEKLIMMDMSFDMVKRLMDEEHDYSEHKVETFYVVGDEEFLPIKENSLDLVISCLGLHWTNDLPGAMIQCRLALKPDGLFIAAILGGETLKELRIACTVAQLEREGGISPRLSPLAQVRDAGNLLTRAGFALPGVDVDEYTVKYDSALELIEHLRTMGENNALVQRRNILRRDTALATAAVYESMFATEDGKIPATFQVIYMTGWKEHPLQQKAKSRGSATISFEDIQKHFGTENNSGS